MAMAYVDTYIYWSFVSPHERDTPPVERTNLRLMTREKIKNLTSTPKTSVLSALTVGILVSTAVSYLSGGTILVMKELWCRVPWGILFVFGAVQVISKVFEATIKNDNPIYYAIPVAVAASSNVVMPTTIPMVIVHELARIQPYSLLYLGLSVKLLLIAMILVTTNVSDLFEPN
ncbi:uncharacterized protein LOC115331410 isoform X2 [Ixodes scapularis]|uniref:uncharacterized protein LOC115331410 isoform X2 n=1 Tax=Ixodes scapularis TaxID=6945 RepID=UPI001C3897E9|nr:uncharacterized protein LOC115331410 isoform X2 [Ixodes scapularis]